MASSESTAKSNFWYVPLSDIFCETFYHFLLCFFVSNWWSCSPIFWDIIRNVFSYGSYWYHMSISPFFVLTPCWVYVYLLTFTHRWYCLTNGIFFALLIVAWFLISWKRCWWYEPFWSMVSSEIWIYHKWDVGETFVSF